MYEDGINYDEDHHIIIEYDSEHRLSHESMVTLREDTWITNTVIDLYVELQSKSSNFLFINSSREVLRSPTDNCKKRCKTEPFCHHNPLTLSFHLFVSSSTM